MDRTVKFGYSEALSLTIIFMATKSFLGYPRYIAQAGLTAGWLIVAISAFVALGFWLIISGLLERFPGKSLMQINYHLLGPFFGLGLNVLLLLYVVLANSILLREFSEAVILTALPDAPISSLTVLFAIPVLFATYLGIEAITRSSFISLPFVIFGSFSALILLYPFWDFNLLLPIFGSGPIKIMQYGFLASSAFSEILILAILAPYFSFGNKELKRLGVVSIGFVAFSFIFITVIYLMVIPVPSATESLVPFYQLARTIYLGRYFQRVEAIYTIFWTFTALMRVAIGLTITAVIFTETLNLPYYKPILPAFTVLFLSLSLTPRSLMETLAIERIRFSWAWVLLAITSGLLFFVLLKGKVGKDEKG